MANHKILKSLLGRRFGLDKDNSFIVENRMGVATTTVTSAQVLALNAQEQTVVAAPGAGLAIVPYLWAIHKPAGTAYAGIAAGEDLILRYTDDSGAQCASQIDTTGFLDQATAETRVAGFLGSTGITSGGVEPVANAPVVIHLLTDEITTGDSDLYVRVWYHILKTTFTNA